VDSLKLPLLLLRVLGRIEILVTVVQLSTMAMRLCFLFILLLLFCLQINCELAQITKRTTTNQSAAKAANEKSAKAVTELENTKPTVVHPIIDWTNVIGKQLS
jgi:hypothetical protein